MSIINLYMRNYLKLFKRNQGFTLIELLVVIGILGVLAAALIATIDPFEQLKKADDSNVKNAAVEFLNANVRYYTTHTAFPWDAVASGGGGCNGGVAISGLADSLVRGSAGSGATDGPLSCVQKLIDDQELKPGYINATVQLAKIYATFAAGTKTLTVCFAPSSKSQQNDKNTKFDSNGATNGTKDCTSTSLTNGCFWCTQ
jgi:prepilin-type N-terminal cleavage/methylation domain-containing protein